MSTEINLHSAVAAIEELYRRALPRVTEHVTEGGKISAKKLESHQIAAHALAYLATESEAARQLSNWSDRNCSGKAGIERKIAEAYIGELVRELSGGVNLGPCESIAPSDLWLTPKEPAYRSTAATASPKNTWPRACSSTRASSASSRAPTKFKPASSRDV